MLEPVERLSFIEKIRSQGTESEDSDKKLMKVKWVRLSFKEQRFRVDSGTDLNSKQSDD